VCDAIGMSPHDTKPITDWTTLVFRILEVQDKRKHNNDMTAVPHFAVLVS
jgi:hypothetical protein